MWNHKPTDGKTRRPATALFLLTLCIGLTVGVRLLSLDSILNLAVLPLFTTDIDAMMLSFAAVAALVQWLLLRNELLEVSVWLPTILSAIGMLTGEIVYAAGGFHAAYWLIWLGAPLYAGSALVIILAWLLPFRRE